MECEGQDCESWLRTWRQQMERLRRRKLANDWNRGGDVFLVKWTGTRFKGYDAFVEQVKIRMGWSLVGVEICRCAGGTDAGNAGCTGVSDGEEILCPGDVDVVRI